MASNLPDPRRPCLSEGPVAGDAPPEHRFSVTLRPRCGDHRLLHLTASPPRAAKPVFDEDSYRSGLPRSGRRSPSPRRTRVRPRLRAWLVRSRPSQRCLWTGALGRTPPRQTTHIVFPAPGAPPSPLAEPDGRLAAPEEQFEFQTKALGRSHLRQSG